MTRRRSKREIEAALEDLGDDEGRPELGPVTATWEMDDDEEIPEDALIIDFTDIDT